MGQDLAGTAHWERREGAIQPRLPSRLNVGVADLTRLLERHVRAGDRVLEIGCAPGKYLVWCARAIGAEIAGIEYAERSAAATARLFEAMKIPIDLRNEDVLRTSFAPGTFDVVYSLGLVEHFSDPSEMIRKHAELARPGGKILIAVPRLVDWYGKIQAFLDASNLEIHNTSIMSPEALRNLAPLDLVRDAKAYRFGRLNFWLLSFGTRLPRVLTMAVALAANALGLVQPFQSRLLAPWIVLEMVRK